MDLASLVVGAVGLLALVAKLTDFLKLVTNLPATRPAVVTQLSAWGAGLAGVFLYSASDFGPTVSVDGLLLNDMGGATKVIVGLAVGSAASLAVDFKQAIDGSDSAKKPSLNV